MKLTTGSGGQSGEGTCPKLSPGVTTGPCVPGTEAGVSAVILHCTPFLALMNLRLPSGFVERLQVSARAPFIAQIMGYCKA